MKMKHLTTDAWSKRIGIVLVATVIIVWLYPHLKVHQFIYEEGRPWNYAQLIAPFDIPIHPDSATVRMARDTLDARFVPIYQYDKSVVDTIVGEFPAQGTENQKRLAAMVRKIYENGVIATAAMTKIRNGELPRVRVLDGNVLSEISTSALTSPGDVYLRLDTIITDPGLHAYFTKAGLNKLLRANIVFDPAENERHYQNDYQTLTADRGVIIQGQAIINKGDIISAQDFTNLQTYEQMMEARLTGTSHSNMLMLMGQWLYAAMLFTMLIVYLSLMEPRILEDLRSFTFIVALTVIFFCFAIGLNAFIPGGIYIVPMAIVPVLVLVFFNGRTGLFTATVTVLMIAPVTSFALEFIYLQFCASAVAVYSLQELSRRSQLLRTSFLVAVAYITGYVALELLMNGTFEGFTWRMPAFLLTNGLLTSVTYILMFAVERIFGFVSVVTLGELADTNQPLLRELSDKCPGTFQHEMSVANLAADAARAMGANEPLVRAGALYHDIGKMANPAFFTENQHGVNPHDTLSPEQSARIVIGHVPEGLRRAEKAGLPLIIRDFITEHHGAGKAKYFYYQACEQAPEGSIVDPTPYTYPGPNPRTRETSLLMMADAVEAASRSLKEYDRKSLSELVDKIVDGQIAEGLHNGSTLEFRDIPLIKEAFVKRLMTMYHTRVAYPAQAAAKTEGTGNNNPG